VGGRANDGGLRIGEMERDGLLAHGVSDFLRESMMERGDKYYMAVCNQSGLVAVYNPAKNLFMSPAVDGPIKYVGSVDGGNTATTHISHVTQFGRSFSVICIPYSLKLLIQELQTINIQMRVITEDNIDQLSNMLYSDNLQKLTKISDVTPQNIIQMIQNEYRQTNHFKDVPKGDSAEEQIMPMAEIKQGISEKIDSPIFELGDMGSSPPEYVPGSDSPEYAETLFPTPTGSDEARARETITEFSEIRANGTGESYRVRIKPAIKPPVGFPADQIWTVVSVNNRFMTIEAFDREGELKREVVSILDVERVDPEIEEQVRQNMRVGIGGELSNSGILGGGGEFLPRNGAGGIAFNPNINIITGGENNISGVGPMVDAGVGVGGGGGDGLMDVTNQVGQVGSVSSKSGVVDTGGSGTDLPNFNEPLMVVKKA
jgi:hypothetical protein